MTTCIIHPIDTGIAVIVSTGTIDINEVARKDVPAGVPYRFIDYADIPTDYTFRSAWTADFTSPDGYGIGHEAWFAEQAAAEAERKRLADEAAEQQRIEAEAAQALLQAQQAPAAAPMQFDAIQGATE